MVAEIIEWFRLTSVGGTYGDWTKAKDSYISQANPTTNYGADATLVIADADGANTRRALLAFVIPPSETLGKAPVADISIYMYQDGTGTLLDAGVLLYDVLKDWIEGTGGIGAYTGVTWNSYDAGITSWATAGALGSGDVGSAWAGDPVNATVAAWESWSLAALVSAKGLEVGDEVSLLFRNPLDISDNNDIATFKSLVSTTTSPTWPSGAPGSWGTGVGDYYRPVIKVTYVDVKPTAVSDLQATPSPNDPGAVKFTWSANKDADFTAYAIYYDTAAGGSLDPATGEVIYSLGRGAAKIYSAGITEAETVNGALGNPGENDLSYYSIAVEDASNTAGDAAYGPEIQVIRPDVLGAGRRNGGATASPETRKVSALGATTFSCGDKMCLAATGKGDNLAENFLVYKPASIIVDWGDGTPVTTYPMKSTTFSGAEAADQLVLSVTDSTVFTVGKCFAAYNGTNFDSFRVTAVTATTITIETDLAEAGRVADSIYFGYSSGDPIYGPLPEHIYTASGAFVPRARLVNSAGFASDWTSAVSLTIATLAPIAVIDASIRSPLTTDTVRYSANRSYNRDGGRPITSYRWSLDHAGTGGDPDADTTTTTVPYTTHNHGSGGTCRVALRVYDGTTYSATGNDYGDSNNPQGDVSLTVAAESVLALPSGLTDGLNQAFTYRLAGGAKIAKVDGVDLRERAIMGDGKALLYVQFSGTAYSSPTSNVPVDVTTLHDAWTNKRGITVSMPRSTSGVATLSGYIENFDAHRTGVNSFDWTMDCVFDAPT